MKYPLNTTSKPVVGSQAKKLLRAIKEGNSFTNAAAQATIDRLIARRHDNNVKQQTTKIH